MLPVSAPLVALLSWSLLCLAALFPLAAGQSAVPLSTPDVQQVWASTFDGIRSGVASHSYAAVVDPNDGSVVMAGTASGTYLGHTPIGAAGDSDAFVVKMTPDSSVVWVRWFATAVYDTAMAVSVDLNGNLYVAGYTTGSMPGCSSAGNSDVFVASLTANGDQRWMRQFGGTDNDYAADVDVDVYGAVYVAWQTGGSAVASLTKLSSNGSTVFTRTFSANTYYLQGSIIPDAQRGLVVVNPIVNLTTDVSVVLSFATSAAASYPYATFSNGGGYDIIVARVSASTGVPIWSRIYQTVTNDMVADIAVDSAGMIWMAGVTMTSMEGGTYVGTSNWNGFLSKLSLDGTKLFTVQFGAGTSHVTANALLVDNAGGVYVAGTNDQTSAQPMLDGLPTLFGVVNVVGPYLYTTAGVVSKYDSDGFRVWTGVFDTYLPSYFATYTYLYPTMRPTHLAFDSGSGQLYIVGDRAGLYTTDVDPIPHLAYSEYVQPQAFIIAAQQTAYNVSWDQYRLLLNQLSTLINVTMA